MADLSLRSPNFPTERPTCAPAQHAFCCLIRPDATRCTEIRWAQRRLPRRDYFMSIRAIWLFQRTYARPFAWAGRPAGVRDLRFVCLEPVAVCPDPGSVHPGEMPSTCLTG